MVVGIIVLVVLGTIVAATPSAVVTNLAFLLSERGVRKSLAFLVGWEVVLVALTLAGAALAVALAFMTEASTQRSHLTLATVGWVEVAVAGIMLVAAAVTYLRGRAQKEKLMTSTMREVDKIGAPAAFGFGAFGASLNLPWIVAASAEVARTGRTLAEQGILLLVFLGVSSVSIAVPTIVPLIWPERSKAWLDSARGWLERNGSTVAAAATALVALVVLLRGAQALGWIPSA